MARRLAALWPGTHSPVAWSLCGRRPGGGRNLPGVSRWASVAPEQPRRPGEVEGLYRAPRSGRGVAGPPSWPGDDPFPWLETPCKVTGSPVGRAALPRGVRASFEGNGGTVWGWWCFAGNRGPDDRQCGRSGAAGFSERSARPNLDVGVGARDRGVLARRAGAGHGTSKWLPRRDWAAAEVRESPPGRWAPPRLVEEGKRAQEIEHPWGLGGGAERGEQRGPGQMTLG